MLEHAKNRGFALRRGSNLLLCFLILFFSLKPFIFAWGAEEPAAITQPQEPASPYADTRYTAEAFSALSDDEKKNVYLNSPQMLPENFSPEAYMTILYPQAPVEEVQP